MAFDVNVMTPRRPPEQTATSSLSTEVKNQIGPFAPSTCAVIGLRWLSGAPAIPSVKVRSESIAFQNFSFSSRALLIVQRLDPVVLSATFPSPAE